MSYSFSLKAASKAEVKKLVAEKLDEVVVAQPAHKHDRDQALAAASAFVDLVNDPEEGQNISISVHGSVGWKHDDADAFVGAGVGISVTLGS